jgi:hypothetical protein
MPWEISAHASDAPGAAEYANFAAIYLSALGDAATPACGTRDIQEWIEAGWAEGFDPEGRAHFGGRLVGKPVEGACIGAAEALVALLRLRFRVAFLEVVEAATAGDAIFDLAARIFEPVGGDGAGGDGGAPKCACGVAAKHATMAMEGPHRGRSYHSCAKGLPDPRGEGCGFFSWAGATLRGAPPGTPLLRPPREPLLTRCFFSWAGAISYARLPILLQEEGHSLLVLGTLQAPCAAPSAASFGTAAFSSDGRGRTTRALIAADPSEPDQVLLLPPDELNGRQYQLVVPRDEHVLTRASPADILRANDMDGMDGAICPTACWQGGRWRLSGGDGRPGGPIEWLRAALREEAG